MALVPVEVAAPGQPGEACQGRESQQEGEDDSVSLEEGRGDRSKAGSRASGSRPSGSRPSGSIPAPGTIPRGDDRLTANLEFIGNDRRP